MVDQNLNFFANRQLLPPFPVSYQKNSTSGGETYDNSLMNFIYQPNFYQLNNYFDLSSHTNRSLNLIKTITNPNSTSQETSSIKQSSPLVFSSNDNRSNISTVNTFNNAEDNTDINNDKNANSLKNSELHKCEDKENCTKCRLTSQYLQSPPFPRIKNPEHGIYGIFEAPLEFLKVQKVNLRFPINKRIFPVNLRNVLENRLPPSTEFNIESLMNQESQLFTQINQTLETSSLESIWMSQNIWNFINLNLPKESLKIILQNVYYQQQHLVFNTENLKSNFTFCNFCKDKGEPKIMYMNHNTIDTETGIVICPFLRTQGCVICGSVGNNAHHPTNCPMRNVIQPNATFHLPL